MNKTTKLVKTVTGAEVKRRQTMNETCDAVEAIVYPAATMRVGEAPADAGAGYNLVKNLIFSQVHKFVNRYGGDFDDLVGDANMAFMKGHAQFTAGVTSTGLPIEGTYAAEIRRWVWFELFDAMRIRLSRQHAAPMVEIAEGEDFADTRPAEFSLEDFTDGMSEDACLVAGLAINPPPAVEVAANEKGGNPRNIRSTIREYLRNECGWGAERIGAAFDEIRKALR